MTTKTMQKWQLFIPYVCVYIVCLVISLVLVLVLIPAKTPADGLWISVVAFFPASLLGQILMMCMYTFCAVFHIPVAIVASICYLPYLWVMYMGAFRRRLWAYRLFLIWSIGSIFGWYWITTITL